MKISIARTIRLLDLFARLILFGHLIASTRLKNAGSVRKGISIALVIHSVDRTYRSVEKTIGSTIENL